LLREHFAFIIHRFGELSLQTKNVEENEDEVDDQNPYSICTAPRQMIVNIFFFLMDFET